jgi:hypothetical protein
MLHYIYAWLPGVVSTLVAWMLGWRQGVLVTRVSARRDLIMDKLLRDAERAGVLDLKVGNDGHILGGSIRTAEIIPLPRAGVVLRTYRPH